MLQELIQKLQDQHGLSTEQSNGVIGTVTSFIKEKVPMLSGAIDNMLHPQTGNTVAEPVTVHTANKAESMMDKINDVIPGQAGEKVEEFAKNAAHKAEEVFDSVKGKLSGMFSGDKK
jgi:hypothetical protein